jgi:uncharacterized membrane protein
MSRRIRAAFSGICWSLAVVTAVLTAAVFAGGGTACQAGRRASCPPQTWLLVLGIVVTLALGASGAVLYKPRDKRETKYPWQYPR